MNLQEAYNFLNFFINKFTGAWYSPEELDGVTDRGQLAYYSDCQPRYGTSQREKEILAPFKTTYPFAPGDTPGGIIIIPPTSQYLDLLDISITYLDGSTTRYNAVDFPNEDERTNRLKSQINPPTITEPIGEIMDTGIFQLYPEQGNTGKVTFLRRPAKPVFVYSVVSGRVIVYNDAASTQLEWRETDQNAVLLKALSCIGINLGEQDVQQYAEMKTQQNFVGNNRI